MATEATALDRFCTEVGRGAIIRNAEVERRLIYLYQVNGSEAARDFLVKSCLRFVVKLAHRYAHGDLEKLSDLVAAGNEGLLVALDHFDLNRTTRLLTYATSWILLHIRQEAQRSSTVVIPVWHQRANRKLKEEQRKISSKTGKPAEVKKLCRKTGLSKPRIERLLKENFSFVSIDTPTTNDTTLLDSMSSENDSADDMIQRNHARKLVQQIVAELPNPEKTVLRSYFGIGIRKPLTTQEIGDKLGVSRERARQLQKRALSLFRKKLINRIKDTERADCAYPMDKRAIDTFLCADII